MDAQQFYTAADEQNGYPRTREALRSYTELELKRSYLETQRDTFNRMFGHNARGFFNLVADELLRREITEIPNIFGPIKIQRCAR